MIVVPSRLLWCAIAFVSCCQCGATAAEKRPVTLDDLHALKGVSDPQISPEGDWVAYTVSSADLEKDKSTSDVWMTRWDGSRSVQLTHGEESEHHARWSPDGQYIAFLSGRGTDDKAEQVWLMDRAGGEAVKVTQFKGGATDYVWSPDSTRLAIIVQDADPLEVDDEEGKDGDKPKKGRKRRPSR